MIQKYTSQEYILALDQGTTSSRTIAYTLSGKEIAQSGYEYKISYPQPGWVEQDPEDILKTQIKSLEDVLKQVDPKAVRAIGITNQRETIIAWDKTSGKALAPAIVWQCRRTAKFCQELANSKHSQMIKTKTGLMIDAYFSASKIAWLLENNAEIRKKHLVDEVVFGTVDSWLIYNLSKLSGTPHFVTEASNASRTMLFNLEKGDWDQELLDLFQIKSSALCKVLPANAHFAQVKILGLNAPICGVLGDQQSSLLGHNCVESNSMKCTFGTGAFLLKNTGTTITHSQSGLLSTVAWSIEQDQKIKTYYALEGSIFIAGSLMKWLRDQMGLFKNNSEVEGLASIAGSSAGIVIVPAFVGLGSPHWDSTARGTIFGLEAGSSRAELIYAALEAVALQVADLLELPELADTQKLSIDGGMAKNNVFNQILANVLNREILLAKHSESTAYGAFCIAAFGAGLANSFAKIEETQQVFVPKLPTEELKVLRKNWSKAIQRSKAWL